MLDTIVLLMFLLTTSFVLWRRRVLTNKIEEERNQYFIDVQKRIRTPLRWWCERSVQIVGFLLVVYMLATETFPGDFWNSSVLKVMGIPLMLFFAFIHVQAKADLWTNWTNAQEGPTVRRGPITRSGLYRYSRNPMYTGTLGMMLGVVLMTQNIFSVALWLLLLAYFYAVIRSEENLLVAEKGSEYIEYCRNVRRFI